MLGDYLVEQGRVNDRRASCQFCLFRPIHNSERRDHRASVKFNAVSNSQLQMNTMRADGSSQ